MRAFNKTFLQILGLMLIGLVLNMIISQNFNPFTNFPNFFFEKPDRMSNLVGPYQYAILILMAINIILSTSLAITNGLTGLFTMGHAGLMAIGAYSSAFVIKTFFISSPILVQFFVAISVGPLVAVIFGFILSFATLRLSGDYLGMVTLGFSEIIRIVLLNIDAVGGARGLTDIPQFVNIGTIFTITSITVLFIYRLKFSYLGRAMLAVKENEMAANMMGINPLEVKIKAFVLSSLFAGMAGALFAHSEGYVSTQTFGFVKSFEVIAMNVLGGLGSITGSIVGAVILTVMPEGLRVVQDFTGIDLRMIIYSLLIILIMIIKPSGIFNTKEFKWGKK